MKRRFSFFSVLAILLCFISFHSFAQASAMQVTVSILPQKYFVHEIGGKHVKINVMVPPGAEPADYAPTPEQVTQLSNSKIYFSEGVPFEKSWLSRFKSASPNTTFIQTQKGIEKMPMAFNDKGERIPSSSGIKDPHIWLSPALVRIQAMNIRDALIQADPSHQQYYREHYLKFAKKINKVDRKIIKIMSSIPYKNNRFMTFHPAWGYFAADYDLRQLPIQSEGKQAGPERLKKLIDLAKSNHIKVIFIEPEFSKEQAKVIAKAIDGKVVAIDPLAEDWGRNLIKSAKAFRDAAEQS